MKKKYPLKDIKKAVHPVDAWWTVLVIDPIAARLLWVIANFTKFTPNQITVISFIFGLASAISFLQGTWIYLVIGAFLFEIAFLFDCVDGKLARLKGLKSGFGGYLDLTLDHTRIFLVISCLVYGQYLLTKEASYFLFGITYIFLYLSHVISVYKCHMIENEFFKKDVNTNSTLVIQNKFPIIWGIKGYFDSKRLSIFPGFVEADTLAFFISPILIQIKFGLLLGSIILFGNILIEASSFFLIRRKR